MNTKSYKGLIVWEKAIELVEFIYSVTERFPRREIFGLINQMRRAAVSVPSNIAEGQARNYKKEFAQFLHQSLGSLAELETQVIISFRINYLKNEEKEKVVKKIQEIQKMLHALLRVLKENMNLDKKILATKN